MAFEIRQQIRLSQQMQSYPTRHTKLPKLKELGYGYKPIDTDYMYHITKL